jgi:hypothetical protein
MEGSIGRQSRERAREKYTPVPENGGDGRLGKRMTQLAEPARSKSGSANSGRRRNAARLLSELSLIEPSKLG